MTRFKIQLKQTKVYELKIAADNAEKAVEIAKSAKLEQLTKPLKTHLECIQCICIDL